MLWWLETCSEEQSRRTAEEARRDEEAYLERRRLERMRTYKLTRQQVEQLEAVRRCQLCGVGADAVACLVVDHDHDTGWVRGVLCNDCNIGIGFVERFRRMGLEEKAKEWVERFQH